MKKCGRFLSVGPWFSWKRLGGDLSLVSFSGFMEITARLGSDWRRTFTNGWRETVNTMRILLLKPSNSPLGHFEQCHGQYFILFFLWWRKTIQHFVCFFYVVWEWSSALSKCVNIYSAADVQLEDSFLHTFETCLITHTHTHTPAFTDFRVTRPEMSSFYWRHRAGSWIKGPLGALVCGWFSLGYLQIWVCQSGLSSLDLFPAFISTLI